MKPEKKAAQLHIMVVTGMSGAGRSTALSALEDLGFFCIDNLPPALVPGLVGLLGDGSEIDRIGFGIDVRTGSFLEGATETIDQLIESGHEVEILFLDCNDNALVRRFSETRRTHPLAPGGDLFAAIQQERMRLAPLRARSERVVDTTSMSVHELRKLLSDSVSKIHGKRKMITRIVSFGFKFGLPADADLVFDLRYLPNPYFVENLREYTGLDEAVSNFVLSAPETQELLGAIIPLLEKTIPQYEKEGKSYLTVAIGCTGGKHRSVASSEEIGRKLLEFNSEWDVVVSHRDVFRGRNTLV